ncbi:MAG: hypothetical protein ABA06_00420 [Parcubacteria bacterium C7867-001]|nr:MAG: hypothetical protein ABA06_00420 [Parcubacteria bacterium C7867-001]
MAKRQKVLIDTSIQIGKLKYKEIREKIREIAETEDPGTSFFVLFEFKVGVILSFIEYWNFVNISENVSKAMSRWSEKYSVRDVKYFVMLQAILAEKFENISTDKKKHLRQVEFIIMFTIENFFADIRDIPVGDFRYDEIVRYEIKSRVDYPGFVKLCYEKNEMVDQRKFWTKYRAELDKLVADADLEKCHSSLHEALTRIQSDIKYAHMVKTNKSIGDAVITVDSRHDTRILTTDSSFEKLAPILGKTFEKIPNKY